MTAAMLEDNTPPGPIVSGSALRELLLAGAGFGVAALTLYALQVLVAREIGPEDFGIFGALYGALYVAAALANGIQVSIAMRAVERGQETTPYRAGGALVQVALFGVAVVALIAAASPLITDLLATNDTPAVLLTGAAIALSLAVPIPQGVLQGRRRFGRLAVLLLLTGVTRLVFGYGAVLLGLGVAGAMGGVLLSLALTFAAGLALAGIPWRGSHGSRLTFSDLLPTVVGSFALAAPTSADVIGARGALTETEAGYYAAAALLGRVVLFVPLSAAAALLPRWVAAARAGADQPDAGLRRGLAAAALVTVVAAAVIVAAPGLALDLTVREAFAGATGATRLYAAAMLLLAAPVFYLYRAWALGQHRYLYGIAAPHIVVAILLVPLVAGSASEAAGIWLGVAASLLAATLAFEFATGRQGASVSPIALPAGGATSPAFPGAPNPSFDLVTLAYNEASTIESTLHAFHDAMQPYGESELHVAEDGSTDGTRQILERVTHELPVVLNLADYRRGYGGAAREGLLAAQGEWLLFVDSDGQYRPEDLPRLIEGAGDHDLVIGGKVHRADPWWRVQLSRIYHGLVVRVFFPSLPVRDLDCGYRLMRREVAQEIAPACSQLPHSFNTEFAIRAHARGYRLQEVPVGHRARADGPSRVYPARRIPRMAVEQVTGLWRLRRELSREPEREPRSLPPPSRAA